MADIIDQLSALDDTALMSKLGLTQQIKDARAGLAQMQALSGDARKEAVSRVEQMLNPHVYASEFKWIAKDAERRANKKNCVEEMCDCSPSSLAPD